MAKTEESLLEEKVNKFMKEKRIWKLARFQAQSNQNGLPDRLYLYKGLLLGLELKTDKGSPTGLQLRKLKEINDNGGIGVIIRSIEDLEVLISRIDNTDDKIFLGNGRSQVIMTEWGVYEEAKNR